MKRKLIIPGLAVFALLGISMMSLSAVYAQDNPTAFPPIIQKLAERFNLNPDEVKDVFEEVHDEHMAEMHAKFEDRLDEQVAAGKITLEQKQMILDKQEEMQAKMEEFKDLNPEERHEQMKAFHEELKTWAEENDIDAPMFMFKGVHKAGVPGMFVEKLEFAH